MRVYQVIARECGRLATIQEWARSSRRHLPGENAELLENVRANLETIRHNCLPSGAGFDHGTDINTDKCDDTRLTLNTAFHHMHESGIYDGWTDHTVTVRPSLMFGFVVTVSGRNRNQIKDYIGNTFTEALRAEFPERLRAELR